MSPLEELTISEQDIIEQGYTKLSGEKIIQLFSGTTVWGNYEYEGWRKYCSNIFENGKVNGTNDWGSYVEGHWAVKNDCFSLDWNGYWENWSAHVYKIDNEFKFYNVDDGKWKTTFTKLEKGIKELKLLNL